MSSDNTVKFQVEGLGEFEAYKEAPQKAILFQRRQQLAKLVGSLPDLIEMECRLVKYQKSAVEDERKIADALAIDLMALEGYIDMKLLICNAPDKFDIDRLSESEYGKLLIAFQNARGFFRPADGGKPSAPTPSAKTQ
jgi:hypothetical protein